MRKFFIVHYFGTIHQGCVFLVMMGQNIEVTHLI